MRQARWLLLVAVGVLMVLPGCKRLGDGVNVANTEDDKLVAPILAGGTIPVGNVYMWNDADNVYIEYILDQAQNPADQWYLCACNADIALQPNAFPMSPPEKGQEHGNPVLSRFAYQSDDLDHPTEYMFTVPIGNWTGTVNTATHCRVCQLPRGRPPERNSNDGWAGSERFPGEKWAAYFAYTFGDGGGSVGWHWDYSWAGTDVGQAPFRGNDCATYITHTIGATTSEELYTSQSVQCGTITVTDDIVRGKGQVYVSYHLTNGWYSKSCFLQFATCTGGIPQVDGNPIPGEFRYQSGALYPYVQDYTFTVRVGWPESVHSVVVAARADVGAFY